MFALYNIALVHRLMSGRHIGLALRLPYLFKLFSVVFPPSHNSMSNIRIIYEILNSAAIFVCYHCFKPL